MSDEYFRKTAAAWLPAFKEIQPGPDELERMLFMFAKEVSRDTRHQAYDIAQAAARDIMSLQLIG